MSTANFNHRLKARLLSTIFRSSTSYPYLSGDAFALLADVVIDSGLLQDPKRLAKRIDTSGTVFCPSHLLEDFLDRIQVSSPIKILIIGNGDRNFTKEIPSLKSFSKYSFIQNSYISDKCSVFTLPIGLENKRLGMNGMIRFNPKAFKGSRTGILVGPFSPTAKLRGDLTKEFFENYSEFDVRENRLDLKDYSKELHSHKYVLCPDGNGIDTHRLWEALYAGAIPVVSKNSWSDSLIQLEIPLIQTDSWTPKNILSAISKSKISICEPDNIEALWMPYWKERFFSLLSD